jgi:hypothetical protein
MKLEGDYVEKCKCLNSYIVQNGMDIIAHSSLPLVI